MTDAFTKAAKKRQQTPKTRRDPSTGSFEGLTPQNDPALLDQCVRWVRAINELEPMLSALASEADDPATRHAIAITARSLEVLRATVLDALTVDPELKRQATNPVLRAARQVRP